MFIAWRSVYSFRIQMLFLWQPLIEILGLFFNLPGVSRFLHGELSLFQGNRVNIQRVSTYKATRKSIQKFWRDSQFSCFDANYNNVCAKFEEFFLTGRERKSLSMRQLSKKFTVWNVPNKHFSPLKNPSF